MIDKHEEAVDKIRRSLNNEFVRMEDDFDETRDHRRELVGKLMDSARKVTLTRPDAQGDHQVNDDTSTGIQLITATLKALADTEKANATAISLKLKQSEQAIASSQAAKDRMAIVMAATAPGRIVDNINVESMEKHLEDMFDASIRNSELKTNSNDLSEA